MAATATAGDGEGDVVAGGRGDGTTSAAPGVVATSGLVDGDATTSGDGEGEAIVSGLGEGDVVALVALSVPALLVALFVTGTATGTTTGTGTITAVTFPSVVALSSVFNEPRSGVLAAAPLVVPALPLDPESLPDPPLLEEDCPCPAQR